jgi:hypothetical protein
VVWSAGALPDFESAPISTTSFTPSAMATSCSKTLATVAPVGAWSRARHGLLLTGWWTAFPFSVTARMRTLEHDYAARLIGDNDLHCHRIARFRTTSAR